VCEDVVSVKNSSSSVVT